MPPFSRSARDLRWCLDSAPLMAGDAWCANLSAHDVSSALPFKLPTPPHPHQFRLGRHFEQLLLAWLEASARYELKAANLQVVAGKVTLGEFDILVASNGEIEHWEAAVKFYLGTGAGNTLDCWFGPNTTDRFDIKYARLVDHQLRLADTEPAQQLLAAKGLVIARSRCLLKGRLFHPFDRFDAGEFAAPPGVNPEHEKGWWMSVGDFSQTFNDRGLRYVYLPKSLWLAPLANEDVGSPLSFYELSELLESPFAEQATHIAVIEGGVEVSRGFVVDERWLARTMAHRPEGP